MHSEKTDRERAKRKAEKEEYGIDVYCYLVCTAPPPSLHLSPILCALLHLPAAMVIRTGGTVGSTPPPHHPHPFSRV